MTNNGDIEFHNINTETPITVLYIIQECKYSQIWNNYFISLTYILNHYSPYFAKAEILLYSLYCCELRNISKSLRDLDLDRTMSNVEHV